MEVTILTWGVAVAGLLLIGLLSALQLVAVIRPREPWTIDNIYGGTPDATDPDPIANDGFAEATAESPKATHETLSAVARGPMAME